MSARIVAHSLAHASAAAAAAAALQKPVTIESAPGAGTYAGARWFLAVVAQAALAHPGAEISALLDCADEPGTVLGALRAGCKRVRFTGRADIRAKLAAIAGQMGAALEDAAEEGALDLLGMRDPEAACRRFLAES